MSPEVEAKIVETPRNDLKNRDLVKFWSGETISLAGIQITELALLLVAVVSRLAALALWRGDGAPKTSLVAFTYSCQ